jgi:hypothetical protein
MHRNYIRRRLPRAGRLALLVLATMGLCACSGSSPVAGASSSSSSGGSSSSGNSSSSSSGSSSSSSGGAAPAPTQLLIEPANATLASGESYPYRATGVYADGSTQDLSSQVQWASSASSSASVSNAADDSHGTVTAGSLPGSVTISAALGSVSASTPLTVNLVNGLPPAQLPVSFPVKLVDFVGSETLVVGSTPYRVAASQMFSAIFQPYYLAGSDAERSAILGRVVFSCAENQADPTGSSPALAFPFDLMPAQPQTLLWHRYNCSFSLNYTDASGTAVNFTSPAYTVNQLDIVYADYAVEPAAAFENYNFGSAAAPDYHYLGRYVQPLDRLLRQQDDTIPAAFIAGVNAGYDYRVDAWSSSSSDNICTPRSDPLERNQFYSHPAPAQCPMGDDNLPSCAANDQLPYVDDLGDSLVLLSPLVQQRSWRSVPFQSYNCGGIGESFNRGAAVFYGDDVYTLRTTPNRGDLAELLHRGETPVSAIGAGPLLIQDDQFVYNQGESEEGMPLDNYEIGGASGVGYERNAQGQLLVHIVNVEGKDDSAGLHDWMLGPYFLSPYAHSDGALALGNGGDATFWVNPQSPAVAAVLANPASPNYAYFQSVFVGNHNPGIVSNCSFDAAPISCSARPVHDGLFVRLPQH